MTSSMVSEIVSSLRSMISLSRSNCIMTFWSWGRFIFLFILRRAFVTPGERGEGEERGERGNGGEGEREERK